MSIRCGGSGILGERNGEATPYRECFFTVKEIV